MDKSMIVNLVLAVLCAAVFGARMYFKTRGSVFEAASQFIAEIEATGLLGSEKMAFVVRQLIALVPVPLKSVFTEERLEELAQEVFDNMKQYALERAKKMDEKKKEEENNAVPTVEPKTDETNGEA